MKAVSAGPVSPVDRFFEFSLLGLLASGYLAVLGSGFLDLPTVVVTAAALLIRAASVAGLVRLQFPAWLANVLTLAYVCFYPVDYLFISRAFIPAAVHLVFFVAVVKLLTAVSNRDFLFLKVIAFLELLAACILSSQFNFFLFLLLFLILGVATFASGEIRQSRQKGMSVARVSGSGLSVRLTGITLFVSVAILVITAGLFFFLPRTARAAFQHFISPRYHLAGFSNQVNLGEIGEIKKENTPVMHVKMDRPEDRNLPLKWRGAVLTEFNGRTWLNRRTPEQVLRPAADRLLVLEDQTPHREESKHISYEVYLNEYASDALFFAGTPQFLRIDTPVFRNQFDNYRMRYTDSHNILYQVYSRLAPAGSDAEVAGGLVDPLRSDLRALYLQLPRNIDPRIGDLTREILGNEHSQIVEARLLEKYLRTHFGYTLELPAYEPADPLAFFLFHRKKGHCEYFASAMAVMLRLAGIPSRMATGFQSGVYNPISGSQLIRTSDAHAWVEAWLPQHGWTTFDPTPTDPNPERLSLWNRLGFWADAADVFWQDWVLNYNLDRQLQLATKMGESSRNVGVNWYDRAGDTFVSWKNGTVDLGKRFGFVVLGLIVAAILFGQFGQDGLRWWNTRRRVLKVQRGQAQASDATLLYERMLTLLRRRGLEKPAWLTPYEFARVVQEPELAVLVEDLTDAYNELRFGGNAEAAPRIVELLDKLESVPA